MNKEEEQVQQSDQDTWCGKMFPEPSAPTKVPTSELSCKRRRKLSTTKPPLFLCLNVDGQRADVCNSLSMDRRCSIAWRVFDAQFWGVPQRRRRIALVADFGGSSAPEILFERKGMSGDFETIGKTGETVTTDIEDGTGRNDSILAERIAYTLKIRSGCEGGGKGALVQEDKSATLSTLQDQTLFAPTNKLISPTYCIQGNAIDRSEKSGCNGKGWTEDVSYTLNTADRPAVSYAIENHPNDSRCKLSDGNTVQTLSSRMGTGGGNTPMVLECYSQDAYDKYSPNSVAPTIKNSGGVYGGAVKH